jgi:hypothetical protein
MMNAKKSVSDYVNDLLEKHTPENAHWVALDALMEVESTKRDKELEAFHYRALMTIQNMLI